MERPPNLAAAIDAAAEALIGVLDAAAARHTVGISPTQLRVLSLIMTNPDANVNRLAELLDVVPSSASRLCDRLEANLTTTDDTRRRHLRRCSPRPSRRMMSAN